MNKKRPPFIQLVQLQNVRSLETICGESVKTDNLKKLQMHKLLVTPDL